MKELNVVAVKEITYKSSITEISALLDRLDKNQLDNVPWAAFPYKPSASFTISYGPDCILLKYFVSEQQLLAANSTPNSPVWQDSCVEFFLSFDDGAHYYNFEFNCIGSILAAHGSGRVDRRFLGDEMISSIKTFIVIDQFSNASAKNWDLVAVIPFTVFIHDQITSLSSKKARANFYKCGDKLNVPHYLAWNEIISAEPDFHLPTYFGTLQL